ncbi:MAG: hypothetical protein ACKOW8_02745, partial [Flavobacteriales bacterium]
ASVIVNAPLQTWNATMHCIGGFYPELNLTNTGNQPISGTFTIQFNPLLNSSAVWSNAIYGNPQAVMPGALQWNINNLMPGNYASYQIHILGPGSAYTGQTFNFIYSLQLTNASNEVFYQNSWTQGATVICSYDPNDKSAEPVGYTEQHYIAAGQYIDYRIRFQNTGNAPAFNVRIEDLIDTSLLNISAVELLETSHEVTWNVNGDSLIFLFNNIMLPDSVNDEPNSHGLVIFRIPMNGMELPTDTLRNSAAIYFDDNEPVITNVVDHVIYDCSMMADVENDIAICQNTMLELSADTMATETWNWILNGDTVSATQNFSYLFNQFGSSSVVLMRTNPICTRMDTIEVAVQPSGCTDMNACNFSTIAFIALCDDGSCTYPGCALSMACNYNPTA